MTIVLVLLVLASIGAFAWLDTDLARMTADFSEGVASAGVSTLDVLTSSAERLHAMRRRLLLAAALLAGAGLAYFGLSRGRQSRLEEAVRWAFGDAEEDEDDQVRVATRPRRRSIVPGRRFRSTLHDLQQLGGRVRASQQERATSRARLSHIADLMEVGVLVVSADREAELASKIALRMLTTEGPLPSQAIVDEIFEAFEQADASLPDQAKVELDLRSDTGMTRLRVQLFHLDETCGHGFLFLIRDRRVLEAIATDLRLATQQRALARLYLGVAHDLKAPLNGMGLNLALLEGSLRGGTSTEDERRRRWLEIVGSELRRLQGEVERLLEHAAPRRAAVGVYDLREVLTGIHDLLTPQARQQGIEARLDLPAESVRIRGRRDLIKQALLNVALNALEAAPDGGRIALSIDRVDRHAMVRIEDDGDGIPDENREHIFEIHFTTKERGTGIGLYIAKTILEAEGGSLVLKETSPSGTILECTLPLDREDSSASSDGTHQRPNRRVAMSITRNDHEP